jgi:cell division protein FtsI/penicillin-binding protein 2|tara:strand:- start:376 stop:1098 length:723 start_codon:yes stop_codon:yes gene_type:complete
MMDTLAGNEELKIIKAKFADKIRIEDEGIAKYAQDKEDRVRMRREREQEQFDRAQAKRQQIIDAAVEQMAHATNTEQVRLEAQQAEFARKEEDAFKLKAEKQRLMKEAIDESRRIQVEMREKKKQADQDMADEMSARWKARNVQLDTEERQERKDLYARAKEHQRFLLSQARDKRNEDVEYKEQLLRDARLQKRLDDEEEGKFFDEVRKTIYEMKAENPNLNLIPVKSCFNLKEGLMEAM